MVDKIKNESKGIYDFLERIKNIHLFKTEWWENMVIVYQKIDDDYYKEVCTIGIN